MLTKKFDFGDLIRLKIGNSLKFVKSFNYRFILMADFDVTNQIYVCMSFLMC